MRRRAPEITAITLDVGGTLIAPHPSVGGVYARIAREHGHAHLDAAVLDTRFQTAWRSRDTFPQRREEWQDLVDEVFDTLVPQPPSTTFFPALYDAFAEPSAWIIYPDTLPALESLSALGMELAVVSNWDDRLRPLLRHLRLDRYFSSVVISCEVGFAKPSPVIFQESLRQLGRPASAVLHVGDGLVEDFAGATGAGLTALHLRRDAVSRDRQIQALTDVAGWIQRDLHPAPKPKARKFLSPDG